MVTQPAFCGGVPGYLHLEIGRMVRGDNFATLLREGEEYSILRGSYVSPWARSVLEDNEIDGLMLDTTWHVIRQYVTAILMAVFRNVGIPLAFAFGAAETLELYEPLYGLFVELFGIDLGQYIMESDQGAALRALCHRHDQRQLICLRHFLLSLKLKEFSLPVGNLVKCRTGDEFADLRTMYENEFRDVRDARRRQLLARTLRKAGLAFIEEKIVIADEARWAAISMWKRVDTRMPSTTNSLEATHGHLNEAISRRNTFWASMAVLSDAIADKTVHFKTALTHDFRAALKRSRRRSEIIPPERMAEECAHFGTSDSVCLCGETVHLSSSYRADLPCSHRFSRGARKPQIPDDMELQVRPSTHDMQYSETIRDRAGQTGWTTEEVQGLKMLAYRQIKRYSHAKNKEAIRQYIDEGLDLSGPSVLEIPLSLHQLISRGIFHFTGKQTPE
jgi:hypothetical protein